MRPAVSGRGVRAHVPPAYRPAFSLLELVVALALLGVIASATSVLVYRSARSLGHLRAVIARRAELRLGGAIVAAQWRHLAADGSDVLARTGWSLEFRATTGGAVACSAPAAGTVDVPLPATDPTESFSWWSSPPETGDEAVVLVAGSAPAEDRWRTVTVLRAGREPAACAGTAFAAAGGGYRLVLVDGAGAPAAVSPGASLRVLRRRRLLLAAAGTSLGYLSLAAWTTGRYEAPQPAAGPYAPPTADPATSGLVLRAFGADGLELPSAGMLGASRLRIVLRAPGGTDTLAFDVALRNAR